MSPSTRRSLRSSRKPSPTSVVDVFELQDKNELNSVSDNSGPPITGLTSSSEPEEESPCNKQKKSRTVTFSLDSSNPPSPTIPDALVLIGAAAPPLMRKAASDRAQRSLRRQAKIETTTKSRGSNLRGLLREERASSKSLRQQTTTMTGKKGKLPNGKDEEVVKIKLNTGTLYMYRGANRRVVFVRKV